MDKERSDSEVTIRVPTGLVLGPNALAQRFGKRRLPGTGEASRQPGRVVTISSGELQLDLFHPHVLEAKSLDDALGVAGHVMSNRTWRTFLCCLGAMETDQLRRDVTGTMPGSFYYAPSRFCDLFGYRRVGIADRHPDERVGAMDANMDALGRIAIETRINRKGKEVKIVADRLVYYAYASLEQTRSGEGTEEEDRAGRRKLLLFRVNDNLLKHTSIQDYFSPLPLRAIAAPLDVTQGLWDDAVKVLTDLSAYARVNARKSRSPDGRPWRVRLDEMAERTNISANARPDKIRTYAKKLLGELQRVDLINFDVTGRGDAETVSYEVTGRDVLSRIQSKTGRKLLRRFPVQAIPKCTSPGTWIPPKCTSPGTCLPSVRAP